MTTVNDLIQIAKRFEAIEATLDKVSPGWREATAPSPEKLSLMHDIRSLAQAQGVVAARRFFDDVVATGKLSPSEFESCFV